MPGSLFVVGPSRSGTELTREMLNRHPSISIAPETHYFDDLRPRLGGGSVRLSPSKRAEAVDYFTSLRIYSYGLAKLLGSSGSSPSFDLSGETGDELFADFCGANSASEPWALWGEKTPRHLFRAEEIIGAFPDAKVLLMMRDPRSVVASYRDWQNGWLGFEGDGPAIDAASATERHRIRASYSLAIIALLWRSAANEAIRLRQNLKPAQIRILHFESLIRTPEATLIDLCAWLGVPFHRDMLDVTVVNSSYANAAGRSGFDPSVAERWRSSLSGNELGVIDLLTAAPARRFGYIPSGMTASAVYLAGELGATPARVLRAALANRRRIGAILPYLKGRIRGLAQVD